MSQRSAKLIDPRTEGRRIDLKPPLFDEAAIARAQETLEALGSSMAEWLDADIDRLQAARVQAEQAAWSNPALEAMMAVSHDLKGMGATYGYPIISDIAASLCRLIETDAGKAAARANSTLVCAHVDALRASARERITDSSHPIGKALLQALGAQVERLGVTPR